MPLRKQNKIMILFVSPQNPIWRRLYALKLSEALTSPLKMTKAMSGNALTHKALIDFIFGGSGVRIVTRQTAVNWETGRNIDESTVDEIFRKTLEWISAVSPYDEEGIQEKVDLVKKVEQFRDAYIAECRTSITEKRFESSHVYHFGKWLGLRITETQSIIDAAIYSNRPLLQTAYYTDNERDVANKDFLRYGGHYYAWMRRRTSKSTQWVRCPLRVRYILEVKGGMILRVKMNVPILDPTIFSLEKTAAVNPDYLPRWEYDGYMRAHGDSLYFILEKRGVERLDLLHIITSRGEISGDGRAFPGKYLTTVHDPDRVVSDDVLLIPSVKSLFEEGNDEDSAIMWEGIAIFELDSDEGSKIEERWKAIQNTGYLSLG